MNWGASCVISLHAVFNYSLFLFSVFLCVPVFYVCSFLSVNFLLCSMGQVAWNKTDDDDIVSWPKPWNGRLHVGSLWAYREPWEFISRTVLRRINSVNLYNFRSLLTDYWWLLRGLWCCWRVQCWAELAVVPLHSRGDNGRRRWFQPFWIGSNV